MKIEMKITIYTIKDCAFSKQEKEYLNANKLVFEEKDLETNKDFLTEMLAVSNNFAGTPVTRVEKDDGTIAVLKGFTKEEFDTTFGFVSPAPVSQPSNQVTSPPPLNDTPIPTAVPPTPPAEALAKEGAESVSPAPMPTMETSVVPPPPVETPVSDPLKSVMDDLQAKAEPVMPPVVEPVAPPTPVMQPPVAEPISPPVAPPTGAPTIPDFPAK